MDDLHQTIHILKRCWFVQLFGPLQIAVKNGFNRQKINASDICADAMDV